MTARRPEPQSGMSALGLTLAIAAAVGLLWGCLIAYSDLRALAHAGEWDDGRAL